MEITTPVNLVFDTVFICEVSSEMQYSVCFTVLSGGGQIQGFPRGLSTLISYSTDKGTNRNILVFKVGPSVSFQSICIIIMHFRFMEKIIG